jgi:hypothetical protein
MLILVIPICLFASMLAYGGTFERYAMIVGMDDGGAKRVVLKYAASDASRFSDIMENYGAISKTNRRTLLNPTIKEIDESFNTLKGRIQATGGDHRSQFIFYYSGHSNQQGLLIGEQLYPYEKLRQTLNGLQAKVVVAILDSCNSGTFTRLKGGTRSKPFMMQTAGEPLEGQAILASSSADEAAQESDLIQGSFFTHHLIAGMRGAADSQKDKLITLNEAYNYAFNETLAHTETTHAGPQHPSYKIQLSGSGDFVLTDLRKTSSNIQLAKGVDGHLSIRDKSGNLMLEAKKQDENTLDLALEPGEYVITLKVERRVGKTTVNLKDKESKVVSSDQFTFEAPLFVSVRGTDGTDSLPELEDYSKYEYQPVHFALLPNMVFNKKEKNKVYANFGFHLLGGELAVLKGAQIAGIVNIVETDMRGVSIAGIGNITNGSAKGVQLAGLGNYMRKDSRGARVTGWINYSEQSFKGFSVAGWSNVSMSYHRGFQLAGLLNYTQNENRGASIAGIGNYSGGGFKGFQVGGIGNVVLGDARGFRVAGIGNYAQGQSGFFEIAGVGNWNEGDSKGVQIAGILNRTRDKKGLQVGLINISGDNTGAQIGLVNIARKVKGTQIGLFNYSEDIKGVPLGLLNVVENGQYHLGLWSNANALNLAFRLGSKYVYTFPVLSKYYHDDAWGYGLGIGGGYEGERYFVNLESSLNQTFSDGTDYNENHFYVVNRLEIGYKLFSRLAFTFGPTYEVNISKGDSPVKLKSIFENTHQGESWQTRGWPSVFVGVRI